MPISSLQRNILAVLAIGRNPDSYVAGGLPLNRDGPRLSDDVDIFHDSELAVATSAQADADRLEKAGFSVKWLRRMGGIFSAEISDGRDTTKLEWVADHDFRFFPAIPDPLFGFVLHPVDLAVNKLSAATSRREPRDIVDLLAIHKRYLPLGAISLAAAGVFGGFTPEGLLTELRRNSRHSAEEFRAMKGEEGELNQAVIMKELAVAIDEAEAFVGQMPSDTIGTVYLSDGLPVQPEPGDLARYVAHQPKRRGHWPTSPELTGAMLLQLKQFKI